MEPSKESKPPTGCPFEEALGVEATAAFQECLFSDQSKGLIHVSSANARSSKIPGIGKDTPVIPMRGRDCRAGTMGGGIAMIFANAGIPVAARGNRSGGARSGLATIRKNYDNSVKKGRLTQEQVEQRMGLCRGPP